MKTISDQALAGLNTALDLDNFTEQLRRALPDRSESFEFLDGRIRDIQYIPGNSALVLYSFRIRDKVTGRSTRQLMTGQMFAADAERPSLPHDPGRHFNAYSASALGAPVVELPEASIMVYGFPADPCLTGLVEATDPQAMKQRFKELWREQHLRVRRVLVEPLAYTPLSRVALGYEVLCESRADGLPHIRRLVGKMDSQHEAAKLFASNWAVWRAADGRVDLAPPVGFISELDLTLQEHIQGTKLESLTGAKSFPKLLRRTARALADLQALPVPLSKSRTPGKEGITLRRRTQMVSAIAPDQAPRVEDLAAQACSMIESEAVVNGLIHGDFYLGNILVASDRIVLIDLDNMAQGDPASDVGRLLASLRMQSFQKYRRMTDFDDAAEAFLSSYLRRSGQPERRARLFEAVWLLKSAGTPFRMQREDWHADILCLLDEVERLLSLAKRRSTKHCLRGTVEPQKGEMDRISTATDPQYMKAVLSDDIRSVYGADLTACQVKSIGDRDRGLTISYRLLGRKRGTKWSLSVRGIEPSCGSGRSAFTRLEKLTAVLDTRPGALSLPRPIAYLPELSLQVLEVPSGVRLSTLIPSAEGCEAVADLGQKLAELHGLPVSFDSIAPLDQLLTALRRKVEQIRPSDVGLRAAASDLWARVQTPVMAVPDRSGPVLRTLSPFQISCADGQLSLTKFRDVVFAHPLIDAGDFLAWLGFLGIRDDLREETSEAAARFRQSYLAVNDAAPEELAPFEAMALLRIACSQANKAQNSLAAHELVTEAGRRLDFTEVSIATVGS